jgi:hypothetical protein
MHFTLPCFLPHLALVVFVPDFEGSMADVCSTDTPSDVIVIAVAMPMLRLLLLLLLWLLTMALASSVASSLWDLTAFFPHGFLTCWLAAGMAPLRVV